MWLNLKGSEHGWSLHTTVTHGCFDRDSVRCMCNNVEISGSPQLFVTRASQVEGRPSFNFRYLTSNSSALDKLPKQVITNAAFGTGAANAERILMFVFYISMTEDFQ